ncbi:DUF11 domain-containing protein [Flavobacterium sp. P21]|uniref:DUF11 domain-containing protein n=1 Tax=Flavobacterium sp. P21 TaxID=3423948 RepID=UPI003D666168
MLAQVQVTDLLPSGYTFTSFNATSGTYNSTTGLWTLDILANSESETLQIIAVVNPTGDYTNIAEVTNSDTPDPDSTPNNGVTTEDDYSTATTTPIPLSSDLSLTKTVNNTTPIVGSEVTFEIVITNNGPQDNNGIQVTDLLPSGYTFTGFRISTGTYDSVTGIWNVGNLVAGDSETMQLLATVNATGNYTNTVEVTATDLADPDSTPNNGVTTEDDYAEATTVPVPTSADLSLTKTVNNPTPLVGSSVTFSIQITNSGPQEANGVVVTDLLPSGYNYVSYSATTGTYDSTNGLWNVGNMPISDSYTLQITALVNATGNYTNSAEITASSQPDPDSTPNNGITTEDDYAEVTTTPTAQSADLSITKTVNNATPLIGSQVTFEIAVTNNGPQDTAGVTVTDLLPSGYTFNAYSATFGTYNNATGLWTIGNLANGVTHNLQITATVNASGTYLNTTEVTASSLPDPDSTPNNGVILEDDYAASGVIPVAPQADLSLTKTVNNSSPVVGSLVTFEVKVTNSGPNDATNVSVEDLLPNGYAFNSYTISTGTFDSTTGMWSVGNLANGEVETLQIVAEVRAIGNFRNIVEVHHSDQIDPDSTPNNFVTTEDDYAFAETVPVPATADLSLTKTVNIVRPVIGSQVTFSIAVNNSGPQDATGVVVEDSLPAGYTFVSYSTTAGTYNSGTGLWTVGAIQSGTTHTLQLTATVNATGPYLNISEVVASDQFDPDSTPNNNAILEDDYAVSATIPEAPSSDLSITKTVDNPSPIEETEITFEIVVTNSGPENNTGVQITDLLPIGFTYSRYTVSTGTYNPTTGLWNVGNLTNGQSETLQIVAIASAVGNFTNIAEVTAADLLDPDSTPNNGVTTEDDYAAVLVTIRAKNPPSPKSDLSITKTVSNPTPLVGSQVTFEIIITNNGIDDNNGVQVTDLLPSGYAFNSFTVSTGTYNQATGIWTVGNLANGISETLQITATVNATGNYLNSAEVTAAVIPDPDSTPNNGITTEDDYAEISTTPIQQASDLSLTKTVNNATPLVGSQVTFEVIVTNNGPQDNNGVQVTDLLPTGYTYNNFTISTGTFNSTTGLWTVGELKVGKSQTLQLVATVNPTGNYTNAR